MDEAKDAVMNAIMRIFSFFHRHKWEIVSKVKCNVTESDIFGSDRRKKAVAMLEKCSICGKIRGRLVTATTSQVVDKEYLITMSDGLLHL